MPCLRLWSTASEAQRRLLGRYKLILAVNTCIYQDLAPIHELGSNQRLYRIAPAHAQYGTIAPEHLRLGYICMTLSHRINRMRNDPQCSALVETFYRYRGQIIHSLSEDIDVAHKRTGNIVIAGVIALLLADVS